MRGLDPQTRAEIIRLYTDEALSTRQVAARVYVSASTVSATLVAADVPRRPRSSCWEYRNDGLTEDQLDEVLELYQAGRTTEEIGGALGVHRTTVARRLRQARAPVRSHSEAIKLHHWSAIASRGTDGLTARQASVLHAVEVKGLETSTEVGRAVDLSQRAARATLYQLEHYGLVKGSKRVSNGGRYRIWTRTDLALRDVIDAVLTTDVNRNTDETWLPIAPLREWLKGLVEREREIARFQAVSGYAEDGDGTGAARTTSAVCFRLRLDHRRLYALLHEQQSVTISLADRLLLLAGDGTRLGDLWPELADDGDVTALPPRAKRPQLKAAA